MNAIYLNDEQFEIAINWRPKDMESRCLLGISSQMKLLNEGSLLIEYSKFFCKAVKKNVDW